MTDLITEIAGKMGRITLNRPDALNALTYDMCLEVEATLDTYEAFDAVSVIVIDAAGDKAFCAGGDIAEMYRTATAGDFDYGRKFWTDEYRLNAKLATGPKPIISFLQGFTMGGGVGIGCHGSHRIVGESSRIAMPECGIGLVPDVGGSLLLARAPGRVGEYLGTTTARMTAADAIWVGFADTFVPEAKWDDLKMALAQTGDAGVIADFATDPGDAPLQAKLDDINRHFAGETLPDILRSLQSVDTDFTADTLRRLQAPSPMAMAAAVELIHRNRASDDIVKALEMEYRYTFRSASDGEFIEGIRALIIDKDKRPKWQFGLDDNMMLKATKMLMPLGKDTLDLTENTP